MRFLQHNEKGAEKISAPFSLFGVVVQRDFPPALFVRGVNAQDAGVHTGHVVLDVQAQFVLEKDVLCFQVHAGTQEFSQGHADVRPGRVVVFQGVADGVHFQFGVHHGAQFVFDQQLVTFRTDHVVLLIVVGLDRPGEDLTPTIDLGRNAAAEITGQCAHLITSSFIVIGESMFIFLYFIVYVLIFQGFSEK